MRRLVHRLASAPLLLALLVALVSFPSPWPAYAASIVVNTNADTTTAGDTFCTLREAITNANADADTTSGDCTAGSGADTITFAANYTITLTTSLPDINGTSFVTITGNGAANTIIQAAASAGTATYRILKINGASASATLEQLTLRYGVDASGGALNVANSNVTLNNVTVSDNRVNNSVATGLNGGAISINGGTITINNSTLSNNSVTTSDSNTARGNGGAVFLGGAGTVNLNNVTVSGNSSAKSGGALYTNGGTFNVKYSTIANNTSDSDNDAVGDGGGVTRNAGTINLTSSIVAGNKRGSSTDSDCSASSGINTLGYNLTGSSTGCSLSGTGDVTVAPASVFSGVLGPLANNGGASSTHLLYGGNAAQDAIPSGTNSCGTSPFNQDQRGSTRPFNGNCDIGAYESQDAGPSVSNVTATTSGCFGSSPARCNAPDTISVQVSFSEIVNVSTTSGTPTLTLETGATDRNATYASGSGTSTLTFTYIVQAGDTSSNLDYTGTTALTLNGGTIQDAVTNNATLTLPALGAAGSLGANNTIIVDTTAPTVTSFTREDPSAELTNADTLIFRATFSEQMMQVGTADFDATGTTASISDAGIISPYGPFTVEVSGGDLAAYNGVVGLNFNSSIGITDRAGNPLANVEPAIDDTYMLDNTTPTVSMSSTADNPTNTSPIPVTATFSEGVSNFTAGDITPGNATVSNFAGSGASYTFDLLPTGNGVVTANIAAGVANDTAGNDNTAATQFSRTYDTTTPSVVSSVRVTPSPTRATSVDFLVTFSEAVSGVDTSDFSLTAGAGLTGASITSVSGGPNAYTVSVSTGSGSGTLRLDVLDDDSIIAGANKPLGGSGSANGSFATGESYTIDKIAPTVGGLVAANVTGSGKTTYTFTVSFSDNLVIDAISLDGNDIRVTGPGGFSQLATLIDVTPAANGAPRTATYQITAPGGAWDTTDNGTYTIAQEALQVFDTVGNAVGATTLGSFRVSVNYSVYLPLVMR